MRVFFVLDETVFFHPQFLEGVIQKTKDEIVGAAVVTAIPKKNNVERDIIKRFYLLHLSEIIKLGLLKIFFLIEDIFCPNKLRSVKKTLRKHKIPYFKVKYNINKDEYLRQIEALHVDVIVSSNSLYFGKRLLSIPQKACINRHSGLLPNNAGLWPCFQAYRKGEKKAGVSVHTMTPNIDDGIVISKRETPIIPGETLYNLYERCFNLSIDAVLEALDKVRNEDYSAVNETKQRNYYSFPTNEQWKEFRDRGGKYI